MANFDFTVRDMTPDGVLANMMKDTPNNLRTSASTKPGGDPLDVTLVDMAELLQGGYARKSEMEIIQDIESKLQGGLSSIVDELGNIPGVRNLLPEGYQEQFDDAAANAGSPGDIGGVTEFGGQYSDGERERIISLISNAASEVGYVEGPGKNHNIYAGEVGVANGQPWCSTFLMAMCKRADVPQGSLLTPGTQLSYENYQKAGRVGQQPLVGSFFVWRYSSGKGHIGLVTGVEGDKISTIEGNTAGTESGDQRNGGMVAKKVRQANYSKLRGYIYPVYGSIGNVTED